MNTLLILLLLAVGMVNVLPVIGLFNPALLGGSYGLTSLDSNTELLLRHRALLFGLLGSFVILSIGVPQWRLISLILAGMSMAGFIVLVCVYESASRELLNIAYVDIVGLVCAALAIALHRSQAAK